MLAQLLRPSAAQRRAKKPGDASALPPTRAKGKSVARLRSDGAGSNVPIVVSSTPP